VKFIAVALLLGVFLRHFSIWGGLWTESFSPQAIFYMLGGMWEAILCAVGFLFALPLKRGFWRNLIFVAMGIGMIEGLTTTGCRYFIADIFSVPKNIDLCDYLSGFHFQAWRLGMYLVSVCWIVGAWLADRRVQ
jgi:hypothetical protein